MKPEPPRAACAGKSYLFDSTYATDHRAAKQLCDTCPVLAACKQRLDDEYARMPAGTPMGTWAGMLIGKRGQRIEVSA